MAIGASALVFGSSDITLMGYGLIGLGGVTAIADIIIESNPYRKLFENLNLKKGEQVPKYIRKRKTDYGYCVTLSLPAGLSTKDFDKNKLAIEQYLNRDVEITYKNHRIYLKVFENKLSAEQDFRVIKTKGIVEFPVGVSFGDRITTVDMEKVVHLLIAGQTGSGKSTLIRGIITNLIADKNSRLNLHLIDLKNGAEFNVFHRCKMVKTFSRTLDEAYKVLNDLSNEVERRYELFFDNDVVDIKEYNKLKNKNKLIYELCIIDEFADMQDEKGSIEVIEHLTRKARAAGIHLILATQRPSADIINGNIKSNVPCTIGLKTRNSLNSRIIIDEDGLENLRGKGHGCLQFTDLEEFQSMFLTVEDAREIVKDTYIDKTKKVLVEEKKEAGIIDLSEIKDLII